MAISPFIVQIDGKNYGPLAYPDLVRMIEKGKVKLHHYLFDPEQKQWIIIGDHPLFVSFLPSSPKGELDHPFIYLYQDKTIVGPVSKADLIKRLQDGRINLYEFAAWESPWEWRRLRQAPFLKDLLGHPPVAPPYAISAQQQSKGKEETVVTEGPARKALGPVSPGLENRGDLLWIIEKGQEELGPFRYGEVLKMIQKGVINKKNRIRKIYELQWKIIEDHLEFDQRVVKKYVESGGEMLQKIFLTRKNKRSSYLAPASIQYQLKTFNGTCSSLSVGGCFIEMRVEGLEVGGDVIVKIMSGSVPLVIESKAKIVSLNTRSPRGAGLKFVNLDPEVAAEIQKFVNKYAEK